MVRMEKMGLRGFKVSQEFRVLKEPLDLVSPVSMVTMGMMEFQAPVVTWALQALQGPQEPLD
jgi:hypothetical protein